MRSDSSLHIEYGGVSRENLLNLSANSLIVELLQLGVNDGLEEVLLIGDSFQTSVVDDPIHHGFGIPVNVNSMYIPPPRPRLFREVEMRPYVESSLTYLT